MTRSLPQTLQTYGIGAAFGALSANSGAGTFAEVCGSPGEARTKVVRWVVELRAVLCVLMRFALCRWQKEVVNFIPFTARQGKTLAKFARCKF